MISSTFTLLFAPPTLTLPTEGRGGVGSVGAGTAFGVQSPPSPVRGGIGRGVAPLLANP